jgi:hypothetical protein
MVLIGIFAGAVQVLTAIVAEVILICITCMINSKLCRCGCQR